jgi:MFS transporter, putative metabolite:H+ symporter
MASPTIAARLDRIPLFSMHRRLAVVVGLGTFFDLYDIFLGGVLAAVLAEPWDLGTTGKAAVIGSAFAGMFVGAVALGTLADRFGRRTLFIANLLIYSVFTLAAAAAPGVEWLVAMRFLAGLGLGAELVIADTYLSELLPQRARGRYIAWAYTIGFAGVPVAAFVGGRFVAGEHLLIDGWRWLLIVGSLGAAVIWAFQRSLPESPRWQETRGDETGADATTARIEASARRELGLGELPPPERTARAAPGEARLREVFAPPYRRRSAMLWIFQVLQTVGYYGFGSLAPLVLVSKGFDVVDTLGYSALIFLGYPLGSAASIAIVERVERKLLIIGSALTMAALGVVFGFASAPALIVASGFALTAASNVFSNGYHIYEAEIFPTRIRATAAGTAYSLSRLTGAILPFVSVAVLDGLGASAVFLGSAAILVLLCVDVAVLGPRTTGRSLESVSPAEA